ncbi:MAG: helix-turn-helix domain-containing protein [Cyclobacteriaceae bacterium]|nr:helix-turn-helix domain-containing protein [Cyclobacteriaceae bacterium]
MNQLSKTDDQPKIQTLTEKGIKKGQPPKGQTRIETLKLYQDGKDPQEIADIRGLKVSTIMTHLTDFIASGEVDIFDLVDGADIERIMQAFDQQKDDGGLKDLYATLNGEYEYDTLRMVGKYRLAIKEEN